MRSIRVKARNHSNEESKLFASFVLKTLLSKKLVPTGQNINKIFYNWSNIQSRFKYCVIFEKDHTFAKTCDSKMPFNQTAAT